MTDDALEVESAGRSAWEAARDWGCDMAQIDHNLTLTPTERLRRHSRALAAALALREGAEERSASS